MKANRVLNLFLALGIVAAVGAAQNVPAKQPAKPVAVPKAVAVPAQPLVGPSERDVATVQTELIKLLRLSPVLTTVVAHDPTLLSNQDYVAHANPQLAQFLTAHPEVGRNPEFYLFSHLVHEGGEPDEALERAVWPDVYRAQAPPSAIHEVAHDLLPTIAFACFLAAVVLLVRSLMEHRRWSRIFKLQSDVHGRLIDKFSTTQELASYMETGAGKRFLEAAPISVGFEAERPVPNSLARVLGPLQIGVVLVLLGFGFWLLRGAGPDLALPMRVLSIITIMPGIGFLVSAAITWLMASRMGLLPGTDDRSNGGER